MDAYRTNDPPLPLPPWPPTRPSPEDAFATCAHALRDLAPDDQRRVLQSLEIFLRDAWPQADG